MSDEKWVTLTPEQVEALDQGVIVRAHRGDTMVQGPLDNVSSDGACVGIGSSPWSRFYIDGPVQVRERDVPKPELLPLPLTVEEKAEMLYQLGKVRAALRGEAR